MVTYDKILKQIIRDKIVVALILKKMVEPCFMQFVHARRDPLEVSIRKAKHVEDSLIGAGLFLL